MSASPLVIRGGTVCDGSGAPGRTADVAIADGRIVAIGSDLRGERELDATGCVVAPGFIDIHTHYDAQVFWDPALRPSSYHGVTTVVAGNCGFTIAPTRADHHDLIVGTLENVEDMDPATLRAGIAWEFETFPEYLDLVRRRGTGVNFTAYVGHSALRLYVMGEAAYERAATAEESGRGMAELVREAIDVGAAGFSTSFSFAHRGVDGKPVPSRFADADEVDALFRAASEAGQGRRAHHPGRAVQLRRRVRVAAAHRSPVHLSALREPERQVPRAARPPRGRHRGGRAGLAPGHAATPHDAVHDGRRLQPEHGHGLRGAAQGRARGATGCVPRSGVAGAGRGGPRGLAHEATLGHLRGLGVGPVPRAGRTAGRRARGRAWDRTARPDV